MKTLEQQPSANVEQQSAPVNTTTADTRVVEQSPPVQVPPQNPQDAAQNTMDARGEDDLRGAAVVREAVFALWHVTEFLAGLATKETLIEGSQLWKAFKAADHFDGILSLDITHPVPDDPSTPGMAPTPQSLLAEAIADLSWGTEVYQGLTAALSERLQPTVHTPATK